MNPEVIVKIKPDGTTTVEASNVQGTSCSLHTAPFIAALGKGKHRPSSRKCLKKPPSSSRCVSEL